MIEFMGFVFCVVLAVGATFGIIVLVIEVVDHRNDLKMLRHRMEVLEKSII